MDAGEGLTRAELFGRGLRSLARGLGGREPGGLPRAELLDGAVLVELRDAEVAASRELADGVIVDLGPDAEPVALEILEPDRGVDWEGIDRELDLGDDLPAARRAVERALARET